MNKFAEAAQILYAKYRVLITENDVRLLACMADEEALVKCTAMSLADEIAEYEGAVSE